MSTTPTDDIDTEADADIGRKPPFLRRVRIRGYKSIAFCDVTLEPLTILVGRNASGKSNFLDALAFLRDLIEMRATEAVNARKGWHAVVCRADDIPAVEFSIEATVESHKSTWDADYSFSLEATKRSQIQIRHERMLLSEHGRGRQLGYEFSKGELKWIGFDDFRNDPEWAIEGGFPRPIGGYRRSGPFVAGPDRLLLSTIGSQPFLDLSEGLSASCVYNFSPTRMRSLRPRTGSPQLVRNGENIARAIEGLRELEPDTVDRVGSYLGAVVRGVKGFRVVTYGEYETVRFSLEGQDNHPPLEFDASSMSDGTLRVLGALIAAFQIVFPSGYPGFVGIEEPETSLHPAALNALVDALDEATLRTQILLSTHSAEMLDNPTIRPESIRVVQMIGGQTVIGPVDEASVEIVKRNLSTLGGLERDNHLEPDAGDLDRQQQLFRSQPG